MIEYHTEKCYNNDYSVEKRAGLAKSPYNKASGRW